MKTKHTTTQAMQAAAKRGLEMVKNGDVNESDVPEISLKSGRKIASGQQISDDHVRSMASYHSAHPASGPFHPGCPVGPENEPMEHCDDLMWGGPAGATWSASRVVAMDCDSLSACDVPDVATLMSDASPFSMEIFSRGELMRETSLAMEKDSEGLIWAPIIRSGTLAMRPNPKAPGGKEAKPLVFVKGYAADPSKEIGLLDLYDAFQEKAVEHVTIPQTHANTTLENTGEIVKLKIADSTMRPGEKVLVAGHKFTEPDVEGKVMRGTVISRSCGIIHDWQNQETTKRYPAVIEHVALTNKPWVTGMEPYGSSMFSENRSVVPMMISEEIIIDPPTPTTEPIKSLFSTADPIESLSRELDLADVQWGDEPSLSGIKQQLWSKLREMTSGPDDEPGCYMQVLDITSSKALVAMDADNAGGDDVWVIPYSVDAQGVLHLSDFSDWKMVEQKWVANDDAEKDKQEIQALLHRDNLSAEADPTLSEETLNLATLTTKARKELPDSAFVFPPKDGKPGRYPIHDEAHARNALARVAQNGTPEEKAAVIAAVKRRYSNIDVSGGKKKTDMSLITDPLARASAQRLSIEPETTQQGATMGLTPELLARLNLDDNAREVLQRELEAGKSDQEELARLRKERKTSAIDERITKLSEMGFKDCPAFLNEVRQILLSDDGAVAMNLYLSSEQRHVHQTATELVDRLIGALPVNGGKLDLSTKANLLDNPLDRRPDLKPEGEGDKTPTTGESLLEQWTKDEPNIKDLLSSGSHSPDGFGDPVPVTASTLLAAG